MIEEKAKSMVEVGHGREIAQEAARLKTDNNCLKCHAKGAQVDKSFLEPTFHFEDGVQCETCHGPGSGYVIWMREIMMGNRRKLSPEVQPKMPTMEDCMVCHREKLSHAVLNSNPFDFEKAWKKIAHPIPESSLGKSKVGEGE
jgi:cytochrome c peroxidase